MKVLRRSTFAVVAVGIGFILGWKLRVSDKVEPVGPIENPRSLEEFLDPSSSSAAEELAQPIQLIGSVYCDHSGVFWLTPAPGEPPKRGKALRMPAWPFSATRGEWSRSVVVEGEFNKLDAEVGFDSLSPVFGIRIVK